MLVNTTSVITFLCSNYVYTKKTHKRAVKSQNQFISTGKVN